MLLIPRSIVILFLTLSFLRVLHIVSNSVHCIFYIYFSFCRFPFHQKCFYRIATTGKHLYTFSVFFPATIPQTPPPLFFPKQNILKDCHSKSRVQCGLLNLGGQRGKLKRKTDVRCLWWPQRVKEAIKESAILPAGTNRALVDPGTI